MSGSQSPQRWRQHVSDLLLSGEVDEAGLPDVVGAGLAGYAVDRIAGARTATTTAPAASGRLAHDDPRLLRGKLLATVRHAAVRRIVVELVGAWRAVGLETLLYKGFLLAEFVYPDPTWRQYSDVDLALRAEPGAEPADLAQRAASAAAPL